MSGMNDRELLEALDRLAAPRVLIVGDLILDRYLTGDVSRISPEAYHASLGSPTGTRRLAGSGIAFRSGYIAKYFSGTVCGR